MVESDEWRKDDACGFVDESGDMRDGEPHVIVGVFFPARKLGEAECLAAELMRMTPKLPAKQPNGKEQWPKAPALPDSGLDLYVSGMRAIGTIHVNVRRSHLHETADEVRGSINNIADNMAIMFDALDGADKYDIRPRLDVAKFREEGLRHPVYMLLLYRLLEWTAKAFRNQKLVPLLDLCLDHKFAFSSQRLVAFLLRWMFYTSFHDVGRFRMADIFGLGEARVYRARIGSDPDVPCLFLADIYAHAVGMIAKGKDPTGKYRNMVSRLD